MSKVVISVRLFEDVPLQLARAATAGSGSTFGEWCRPLKSLPEVSVEVSFTDVQQRSAAREKCRDQHFWTRCTPLNGRSQT